MVLDKILVCMQVVYVILLLAIVHHFMSVWNYDCGAQMCMLKSLLYTSPSFSTKERPILKTTM